MNKIIHYFYDDIDIWKKNPSPQFRMCYASWKKFCPDYEIKLWHTDMPEFKEILKQSKFVRECYKRKMWAFLADYVRYYAIYNYGGIYLDTDVQLLSDFDKYLDKQFFTSIEGDILYGKNVPEPAIIGGEKGNYILKKVLDLYNSDEIFKIDFPTANIVLQKVLQAEVGFENIEYSKDFNDRQSIIYDKSIPCRTLDDYEMYRNQKIFKSDKYGVEIYPSEYFVPTWNVFEDRAFTDNTISIHWGQCSWWDSKGKLREIESYRYKNPIKRWWYVNSDTIAKSLTFWIPGKKQRRVVRNLIVCK